MHCIGLDEKEYRINFSVSSESTNCSDLHVRARNLLKSIFRLDKIFEEIILPGSKVRTNKPLRVDFFIPQQKLICEVQGQHHYFFVPFFHKTIQDFYKQKQRDVLKRQWSEINSLKFIELPYSEDNNEWQKRITN